jgi:hypothetical protein
VILVGLDSDFHPVQGINFRKEIKRGVAFFKVAAVFMDIFCHSFVGCLS